MRRTDLTQPQNLADLLNHFYAYTEPEHEDFEQAVEEFKDRVPDLARGLADKINTAHQGNAKFQAPSTAFSPSARPPSTRTYRLPWETWEKIERKGTIKFRLPAW